MEMPSHGVPPVVHHYENEASPIAPPLDWGPLFAHGLRQLHRPWFKGLNRTHERIDFLSSSLSSCLSMQSMVTSPLTYALVRPFWMDRERERKCVGVLMDFIFKFVRFFFFFPPTNSRVLLLSECECSVSRGLCVYVPSSSLSLMSPLGYMTTICHQLHDLRFGCTINLWFKHHTFLFLIFLFFLFSSPGHFFIPLDWVGRRWRRSAAMYACR